MKFYTEVLEDAIEYGVKTENEKETLRIQVIADEELNLFYDVLCNDRFEENDFRAKVFCDMCEPKFVPKVIEYGEQRFCKGCLTKLIQAIDAAIQDDCAHLDRTKSEILQKILED
jgi:hypothetical protein